MKPLNTAERRKAFFQYLAMYLLTTALLVFALFFNWKTPEKQNAILLEKVKKLEAQVKIPDEVSNYLEQINNKIKDIQKLEKTELEYAKREIINLNSDLKTDIDKDSLLAKNFTIKSYYHVIKELTPIIQAKIDLEEKKEKISGLENELRECKEELKTLKNNARIGNIN